jgi:hypothetical protein
LEGMSSERVNFAQVSGLLEDIQGDLAESILDWTIAEAAEMALEDVPDEVKNASREAFQHSGLHGFAASAMDPKEHHSTASSLHHKAAALAKKHGLVKLSHMHQKKALSHAKQARETEPEESVVGLPDSVLKEYGFLGGLGLPESGVGRKAQGQTGNKSWVQRHGHKRGASRRSYSAAEKAAETKVRQAGKKAARDVEHRY